MFEFHNYFLNMKRKASQPRRRHKRSFLPQSSKLQRTGHTVAEDDFLRRGYGMN